MTDLLTVALDACIPPSYDFLLDVEAGAVDVLNADGRNNHGDTSQSLFVTPPVREGNTVAGSVGASEAHAIYVRDGRRPGTPPPYAAIEDWVESKLGFGQGNAPWPLVRSIQQTIGERGTDGTDFIGRPVEALLGFFLADLGIAVASATGDAVQTTLQETADGLTISLEVSA